MTATSREKSSSYGQWARSGHVIALVRGRADAARVSAALRPMPVQLVSTLDELRSAVEHSAQQCAGVLLEARDRNGESTGPFINTLARHAHRLPILGYVSVGALSADELRELASAGVHELVFREVDDSAALLRGKFARGEESRAAAAVIVRIRNHTPTRLLPVAEYVLNYPRDKHSVARVASALGINRKTLTNWCIRERCAPAGILITWCRLLLAAELLQIPGRSVERTVNALEFSSPSSFRNLSQRYLRRRPSTLSEPGALDEAYAEYAIYMSSGNYERAKSARIDRASTGGT